MTRSPTNNPSQSSPPLSLLLLSTALAYLCLGSNHKNTENNLSVPTFCTLVPSSCATAIQMRRGSSRSPTRLPAQPQYSTIATNSPEKPVLNRKNKEPSSPSISSAIIPPGGGQRTDDIDKKAAPQMGNASFATSVFNLANNVAGAGLLTLAAGKASGATGWVPSVVICVGLAFMSGRTFTLIGKACELTGERTFKGLWTQAFGPSTAYVVDSIVFLQCFISSTIYIGLLGDIFSAILRTTSISHQYTSRTSVIIILATTVLFPLNLIKNLSALAFTSILGLAAVLYTVFFMIYRSIDGSYSTNTKTIGRFLLDNTITKPSFTQSSLFNLDLRSLVLISNLGLAFIAHYNAPTYYREMKNATNASFSRMVYTAYLILALIYVATMTTGYATFGDSSRGNILLSYHPSDYLATLARVSTGLSVVFGFPLVSNGAREGFKNASAALGYRAPGREGNHGWLVVGMLVGACMVAVAVEDVKVIAGFSGAAMGSFLVYVCPTVIYLRIVGRVFGVGSGEYKRAVRWNVGFVPFGVFLGIMGVVMNYRSLMEGQGKVGEVVAAVVEASVGVVADAVSATATTTATVV